MTSRIRAAFEEDAEGLSALGAATFTATFAIGVSIKNIVLHGNQNKNWITWPSAEYLKGGYSTGFLPIFEFDDGVKQRLDDELFDALRALNVDIKHEG